MNQAWIKSVLFSLGTAFGGLHAIAADAPTAADKGATAIFAGGCF